MIKMVGINDVIYYYTDTTETVINKGTVFDVDDRYCIVRRGAYDIDKVPKCMIIGEDAEHKYELNQLQKQINELRAQLDKYKDSMRYAKAYTHKHFGMFYKYVEE